MKIVIINTWQEFCDAIANRNYREWLYRGQSNSNWTLQSSLYRTITRNTRIRNVNAKRKAVLIREKYEKEIISHFVKAAHLYLSATPEKNKNFDWLSVMQHYGAPTRMLDFSFSPFVALFFAIIDIQNEAAVYCIKYHEIIDIDKSYYNDIEKKYNSIMETQADLKNTILVPFEPSFTNERLLAQQGAFLIPNTLNFSHDEILHYYQNDKFVIKLIIKESAVRKMLEELMLMNISYSNLFPGLEGFCKSFETIGIIPINRLKPIND
jgi:hypothetical protein